MKTAVLVLEDDAFVRKGIVRQLGKDPSFAVTADCGDLKSARQALAAGTVQMGIFDLELPDGNAVDLLPEATAQGTQVLVLTVFDDDDIVYRALAAGAGGYLLKSDAAAGRVTESLSTLRDGGAPISPMIARRLLDDLRKRPPPAAAPQGDDLPTLTARESQIMELFAKGATYEEVASMLSMSINTVRHHVRGLYRKLHVCSKAEAVTATFRRG